MIQYKCDETLNIPFFLTIIFSNLIYISPTPSFSFIILYIIYNDISIS